ncbi:MAG: DNA polymerase, partial [Bacteroidales bacterium]
KIDDRSKKGKKQYSTDEETLSSFAGKHPIVPLILEYRSLKKLLSSYIESLPSLVDPSTGRIHTTFNQTVTATGRLSSQKPNLQNIPVREERGREIRKFFIPRDGEHILMSADYSQIELRIMAHMSGDRDFIAAFNAGADIHTSTAAKIFHCTPEEVTPEQRNKAKTANFGIIYGISVFGLASRLRIPRTEAKELIEGYFTHYPGVREFLDKTIEMAKEKGYVETLFHRRRYAPDINTTNPMLRGLAERNAINAPIQGTAADIIKKAMVSVHREILAKGLKSRMILQVHDELLFDIYLPEKEVMEQLVRAVMEHVIPLSVPLSVSLGFGANWLEAH